MASSVCLFSKAASQASQYSTIASKALSCGIARSIAGFIRVAEYTFQNKSYQLVKQSVFCIWPSQHAANKFYVFSNLCNKSKYIYTTTTVASVLDDSRERIRFCAELAFRFHEIGFSVAYLMCHDDMHNVRAFKCLFTF